MERLKELERLKSPLLSSLHPSRINVAHDINHLSMPIIPEIPTDFWSSLKNNCITLRIPKLLHTRCSIFEDTYSVLATKKGEYEIQFSIISEELENPIEFIVPARIHRI